MRICYYIKHAGLSGGVKVMLQHVSLLGEAGYDALFVTRDVTHEWTIRGNPEITKIGPDAPLPPCDVYVGTRASDVEEMHTRAGGLIVHLCQGYEPATTGPAPGRGDHGQIQEKRVARQIPDLEGPGEVQAEDSRVRAHLRAPTMKAAVSGTSRRSSPGVTGNPAP
jgi:hypothetical protein